MTTLATPWTLHTPHALPSDPYIVRLRMGRIRENEDPRRLVSVVHGVDGWLLPVEDAASLAPAATYAVRLAVQYAAALPGWPDRDVTLAIHLPPPVVTLQEPTTR